MRKILFPFIAILSMCSTLSAQTVFWTETFGTGCNHGQLASSYSGSNGAWTIVSTGTNGTSANDWFISATEAGMAVGTCGNGCLSNGALTNRTLHIANIAGSPASAFFCPSGDCGAAYDAGPSSGAITTDKRATSPTINCSGFSTITLNFKYIEKGQTTLDHMTVWYFDGSVWAQVASPSATNNTGCLGQGKWAAVATISLPASANNNANVKIGFRWVNNDDGTGSDPSVAIDDVTLSYTTLLPIELLSFNGVCSGRNVLLNWQTASEHNNDFFTLERSSDGLNFVEVARIDGAGNSDQKLVYSYTDPDPSSGYIYYRLKQTDYDGSSKYQGIIVVDAANCDDAGLVLYNCWFEDDDLNLNYSAGQIDVTAEIFSSDGQLLRKEKLSGTGAYSIEMSSFPQGVYLIRLSDGFSSVSRTVVK